MWHENINFCAYCKMMWIVKCASSWNMPSADTGPAGKNVLLRSRKFYYGTKCGHQLMFCPTTLCLNVQSCMSSSKVVVCFVCAVISSFEVWLISWEPFSFLLLCNKPDGKPRGFYHSGPFGGGRHILSQLFCIDYNAEKIISKCSILNVLSFDVFTFYISTS